MITNIIQTLINDFPSLANTTLNLVYHNEDDNQFAVKAGKVILVVNAPHERTSSKPDNWKANMIADHIYMAATMDYKPTLKELSDTINNIIDTSVVFYTIEG